MKTIRLLCIAAYVVFVVATTYAACVGQLALALVFAALAGCAILGAVVKLG